MFMHRIKLKNVLSFAPSGQDLGLEPLNVLIGPNGSGKSNLIEVVGLLQGAPENLDKSIRDGGGVGNWVWRGDPPASFAEIEADFFATDDSLFHYKLCFHEIDQRFHVHSESLCETGSARNSDPTCRSLSPESAANTHSQSLLRSIGFGIFRSTLVYT